MKKLTDKQVLFQKAESGCIQSQLNIASALYEGKGLPKDQLKSLDYYYLFYRHSRANTCKVIPCHLTYFRFMAYIALEFLNYDFIDKGKEFYSRVIEDAPLYLPQHEVQQILNEFKVIQRLEEIEMVESRIQKRANV